MRKTSVQKKVQRFRVGLFPIFLLQSSQSSPKTMSTSQIQQRYNPTTQLEEYPESPRPLAANLSFIGAVLKMSLVTITAGIMVFPETFKEVGLIPGILMILVVAVLTDLFSEMLVRFSRTFPTYGELVENVMGWHARFALQFLIVLTEFSLLVLHAIMITDVFAGKETVAGSVRQAGVLEQLLGENSWTTKHFSVIFPTLLLTLFLSYTPAAADFFLRYTTPVSVFMAILVALLTIGLTAMEGILRMPETINGISLQKLSKNFASTATTCFCQSSVHDIRNRLKDPNQMRIIVMSSLTLCSMVYLLTGSFGLIFGDHNLNDMVRMMYGLHLILFFPNLYFAFRHSLPFYINSHAFNISMVLIFLSDITGLCAIWDVVLIIGATCVGFIFPAMIALSDSRGMATKRDKTVSLLMILCMFCSIIIVYYDDIYTNDKMSQINQVLLSHDRDRDEL